MALNKSRSVATIHRRLDAFEKATRVAGYVILSSTGRHVATVRIKFPRDGAGRLEAMIADWSAPRPRNDAGAPDFDHWTPWQHGWANGYGYDKQSAAVSGMTVDGYTLKDDGHRWYDQLRDAGFTVIQAC